jgi:hypothetical protein
LSIQVYAENKGESTDEIEKDYCLKINNATAQRPTQ